MRPNSSRASAHRCAIPQVLKLTTEVQQQLRPHTVYQDPELVQRGLVVIVA
jgi:hypothetical protein